MNRRLQIDIDSIEKQHEEEEEYDENEQSFSQEDSELRSQERNEQHSQQMGRSEGSPQQVSKSGQAFESVQTFGNNNPYSHNQDLLQQLIHRPDTYRTNKLANLTNHNLSETPIAQQYTPNSYSNRRQELEHSNVDDEIARIISKVNQSVKMRGSNSRGQMVQVEKVKKINRINDQLLKENTQLINEISQLERKMNDLNGKLSSKKKMEDSTLVKALKKYKEKLDSAMNLNSKLSVRLTTERSRSNIISNTFRSMVNKEISSSSMVSNSLKNHLRGDSGREKNRSKKQSSLSEHVYCDKCCKEIQPSSKNAVSKQYNSRELIFSPVLQVKNYEISAANPTNQFELNRKNAQRDVQVQVGFGEDRSDELEELKKQEEELQRIIEVNNKRLAEYEDQLYRMVEIN